MYCNYDISLVKDLGNRVEVIANMYEGQYQFINGEDTYVRGIRIGQARLLFEKSPVEECEIFKELARALEDVRGNREIIPECL